MNFEWDTEKDARNRQKHGIGFDYACYIFADPNRLEHAQSRNGEDRWKILGQIENGVFVVITHDRVTREGIEVIRIISARKATSYERHYYFKNRSQF
ncbi:BrnT family toxin [Thalassospira australica]|uniref:BrnT family toxin n=1 Tax=Thalassospira australica TaxID=1528106 RepID=UPI0038502188